MVPERTRTDPTAQLGCLKLHEIEADSINRKYMPELPDSDAVLVQFNHLIKELLDGDIRRNSFRPWEIDILIDIESCDFGDVSKQNMLRRYQNAVRGQMEKGARLPLKLSEYMELLRIKRTQPKTRV